MSGIYIPGMEMPKNCHDCPLCFFRRCLADGVDLTEKETRPHAERREACTLIPVPEHGRLGDLDAIVGEIQNAIDNISYSYLYKTREAQCARERGMEFAKDIVLYAPTVIPPSKEET